jgi:hypothetical protein
VSDELFYLAIRPPTGEAVTHGPAAMRELRTIAEHHHGAPLHWYEAYSGNLYADTDAAKYAIRAVISQTWPARN